MKFYPLIRQALFCLDPELAHSVSLKMLNVLESTKLLKSLIRKLPTHPCQIWGLQFPNIIGLAAGLDKNGDFIDSLGSLGFGHIEIGTITPQPQSGNPKPRLFRIPEAKALINRMGFNNKGVDYLISRLQKKTYSGILGINIGKNAKTPLEKAEQDYLHCLNKVYSFASYVTINISSPNTPGLRDLQNEEYLNALLLVLKKQQMALANQFNKYVPLIIKISPDISPEELKLMTKCFLEQQIDGIIATNTTCSREGVEGLEHANEQGGLSGKPLFEKSTAILKQISMQIPILASGGVMSGEDALMKVKNGAKLVQLYSGLIYEGPKLIYDAIEKTQKIPRN